jgi:ribosomal-protein-alanine N-acetyltransferase
MTHADIKMKVDKDGRMLELGEFPVLETKRLVLRRMTMDDDEFFLRNFSDPVTVDLTGWEPPKNIESAREELREHCIDNFTNSTGIRWGVTIKGNHDLIGTLGIYKWDKVNHHAEMGYDLLPEHRNKGIMTEAMTAVLDYVFGTMRLNRVCALIDPRNSASRNLLLRLGFSKEGEFRESTYFRGKYLTDVVYALLSNEWKHK